MPSRLPMLSAQFAFTMEGERTGRRGSVCLQLLASPGGLVARDVEEVLASVAATNPALCYRPRFSHGEASQEWVPGWCDFGEFEGSSDEVVDRDIVALVARFEAQLKGPPMAARLIRTPVHDRLVIVLDHALVDEHSLLLITRQLAAPRTANPGDRPRFEAAVYDRIAFESAAVDEISTAFWKDRLGAGDGVFPQMRKGIATTVPTVALPAVTVPMAFQGSLFPYLLFSLHRTVRDILPEAGKSILGYPWGGRDARVTDLVGCFMNTAVSLDTTGSHPGPGAAAAFRASWLDELDHINVPLTQLMGLGTGFAGAVSAYVSYSNGWLGTVDVAGVEAVQVSSTYADIPVSSTFQAAAAICDGELQPLLIADEKLLGERTEELGARWLYWLNQVMLE